MEIRKQSEIAGFSDERDGAEEPFLRFLRPPQKAEKLALVEKQMGAEPTVRRGVGRRRCPLEFCFRQLETLFGDVEPPLGASVETRAKQAYAGHQLEPGVIAALSKRESFLAIAKRLL